MPRSGRKSARKGEKAPETTPRKDADRENPFVFKILNETQTKHLMELDVEAVEREMIEILSCQKFDTDLLEAIQLDFFVGAFWWAKEQGFTAPQVSAFFTGAHHLLNNVKEKHMHVLDNLNALREMMAGVGQVECDNPGGLECFDTVQARSIAKYFHDSLFQHYRLHQFVFSHTQAEEIIGLDLTCELVPPANRPYPPPLVEGLSHDIWEKYVKTPPPSPPPETESEAEQRLTEEEKKLRAQEKAEKEQEYAKENELLSQLTPEEIQQVVDVVTKDAFKNLNMEMASKLRDRENTILGRINKVHNIASEKS